MLATVGPIAPALAAAGDQAEGPWVTEAADRQLIVEWERDAGDLPLLAETVVEAVLHPGVSALNREVHATLGAPALARLLVQTTLPADVILRSDRNDPEIRILQFVVLTYRTAQDTDSAFASLRRSPRMRTVDRNALLDYAIAPVDPHFATIQADIRRYQWGLQANAGTVTTPQRNLQAAWDHVRGTAYVAVLDNGIQTVPDVHPDLTQNYRPQFSRSWYNVNIFSIDEMEGVPASPGWAGHGTHVAGIIAANTTHPALPAGYPNPPAAGGAGVCWYCSFMMLRVTDGSTGDRPRPSMANTAAGLALAAQTGAQVINLSFGSPGTSCSSNGDNAAVCVALEIARQRDAVIVAAVGNQTPFPCTSSLLDFPANISQVGAGGILLPSTIIPVGAATHLLEHQPPNPPVLHRPTRWIEAGAGNTQSNCGPDFRTRGLMAPGVRMVSTFYANRNWNPGLFCGDAPAFFGNPVPPFDPPGYNDQLGDGYGQCTGTSMATPFVAGVVGLMRSISPRSNAAATIAGVLDTGSSAFDRTNEIGSGMVNAEAAVQTQLAIAGNRLTPLFSLYGASPQDHFYTVVPQMGTAARKDTMALRNPTLKGLQPYQSIGNLVANYVFPSADNPQLEARAQLWVFSTQVNPFGGDELRPLLRYSYACYDTVHYPLHRTICTPNRDSTAHIDHAYVSTPQDGATLEAAGYRLDGIEGYLLPNAANANVVAVLRARNASRDDWAVFPISEQAAMADQGYTADVSVLGYAYPNLNGSQPTL